MLNFPYLKIHNHKISQIEGLTVLIPIVLNWLYLLYLVYYTRILLYTHHTPPLNIYLVLYHILYLLVFSGGYTKVLKMRCCCDFIVEIRFTQVNTLTYVHLGGRGGRSRGPERCPAASRPSRRTRPRLRSRTTR